MILQETLKLQAWYPLYKAMMTIVMKSLLIVLINKTTCTLVFVSNHDTEWKMNLQETLKLQAWYPLNKAVMTIVIKSLFNSIN